VVEERDLGQYKKGLEFEGFIRGMFPDSDFEILFRSDEVGTKVPDFYIRDKHKKYMFWVEAKWRYGKNADNKVDIFEHKLDRLKLLWIFQAVADPEKVLLVLGLGGSPSSPIDLFRIPVLELGYPSPFRDLLENGSVGGLSSDMTIAG